MVFSQPVPLALVGAGLDRDTAYRIVQRNALAAWEQGKPLRTMLEGDTEVALSAEALDDAFDLDRALRNTGRILEHLEAVR